MGWLVEISVGRNTLGRLKPQTAANRATALRLFLRANHLLENDVVGAEARCDLPQAMDRLVVLLRKEGRTDRSISNTRSALTALKNAVITADAASAMLLNQLPRFSDILKNAIGGLSAERVARECAVSSYMLRGWLSGKMPRASNAIYIRRIEGYFGMARESLVSLSGITDIVRAREPIGGPQHIDYRENLGAHSRSEYYLAPPLNSPLREQWKALILYKTAAVPTLKRIAGGRWTFSPHDVKRKSAANWYAYLDEVEVPTARAAWTQLAGYLGWMALPHEKGGLGMNTETLQTLAWLAVPNHIDAYLEWRKMRCGNKRTESTSAFLSLVGCLLRPRFGFLTQQPSYLATLPESFRSEEWQLLCERQFEYISQLKQAFVNEYVISRDPFEPIRSVIDLPQPLEAVADMVQRMRRDRPTGCVYAEAIWARDIFLVKLLVSNPLRLRNIATMTWTPANVGGRRPADQGSLYQRDDGSWWIFVPKRLLKNRRGQGIFDYHSPVHQSVWKDLERYLFVFRDELIRWPTDLVFIAGKGGRRQSESDGASPDIDCGTPGHRPFMDMSKRIFYLTRKYLWKSGGIGMHAFRHIVATSILKTDAGDIKTAALVLNDAEATVAKHYSGMRSGDGATRMGELLGKTLNRM